MHGGKRRIKCFSGLKAGKLAESSSGEHFNRGLLQAWTLQAGLLLKERFGV